MRFAPGSTPPRLSDNLVTLVFSVSVGFVIADSTIRYYLKSATRERIGLYTFPSSRLRCEKERVFAFIIFRRYRIFHRVFTHPLNLFGSLKYGLNCVYFFLRHS